MPEAGCILCGSPQLHTLAGTGGLPGVTSDCKPWPHLGDLAVCLECGHCQKPRDAQWLEDIGRIYDAYEMYPLSEGREQQVFHGGAPAGRSEVLLDHLEGAVAWPPQGRLLDVGCGNGAFLRAFGARWPGWSRCGLEQSEGRAKEVSSLGGVDECFWGKLDCLPGKFDLITLNYVIEHFLEPVAEMRTVAGALSLQGLTFVQTSYFSDNPFDLAVRDHCSHFTPESLAYCLGLAGLSVKVAANDWIAKEIGALAGLSGHEAGEAPQVAQHRRQLERSFAWLLAVRDHAKELAGQGPLGIMGTAIAGTWLGAGLGDAVSYFVDEDASKHGKKHLGASVLPLEQAPAGSHLYLAFPPKMAAAIKERLSQGGGLACSLVTPPPLEGEART